MREYHLAVIAGDGIGREVMPEALATLDAVAERWVGCASRISISTGARSATWHTAR